MGQRQPVPLCVFVSWVKTPTLGPTVQRPSDPVCAHFEYPELAYLCEWPAAGLALLLGLGEGDDPEDTLKTCLEHLVHPAKDLICNQGLLEIWAGRGGDCVPPGQWE